MPTINSQEAEELNDRATICLFQLLLDNPPMTEEMLEARINSGLDRIPRGDTVVEGVRALMRTTLGNSEARLALRRLTGLATTGLTAIKESRR